ncbi:MAG: hypothetical protein ISS79_03130 [Phycisphaerae bacterium]|nr:hypothetical protein [Phycisphaerae bacterium]
MEKKSTNPVILAAGAVVVLAGALGLGMGIRHFRANQAQTQQAEQETEAVAQSGVQNEPAVAKGLDTEAVEASAVIEEVVEEANDVVAEAEEGDDDTAEGGSEVGEEFRPQRGGHGVSASDREMFQRVWGDLNLTLAEIGRIQAGFMLLRQRWENMPEEERQFQIGRFRGMRGQWEAMSAEEREGTMVRLRDRFEDWRASGAIELPDLTEFTLD